MLGLGTRPFASDIHTLNVTLINQPGALARVLTVLHHHNMNIESARIYPSDVNHSSAVLAINAPLESLDLLHRKVDKLLVVTRADIVPAPVQDAGPER